MSLKISIQKIYRSPSFGGILLFISAIVALVIANTPLNEQFNSIWQTPFGFSFGNFELKKSLLLWVNDGLMAVFFFLIGLEIKREIMLGELSTMRKAAFPIAGAIGGMLVPALLFFFVMKGKPGMEGWGIPMATDIAFSLGILSLLGKRVPLALKVFLTAFAIVDDIGAVLVIAIFYTGGIDFGYLIWAIPVVIGLFAINKVGIKNFAPYFVLTAILWYLFLKAGIHPTIAGILGAFFIPISSQIGIAQFFQKIPELIKPEFEKLSALNQTKQLKVISANVSQATSPAIRMEKTLHGFSALFIMPIFALANAGVAFGGSSKLFGTLTFAIIVGLVLGKLFGVLLFTWLASKLKLVDMPKSLNWYLVAGAGLLGGVGFTMALFISNLAFTDNLTLANQSKIGILIGSLIAGLAGYFLIKSKTNKT